LHKKAWENSSERKMCTIINIKEIFFNFFFFIFLKIFFNFLKATSILKKMATCHKSQGFFAKRSEENSRDLK